MFLNITLASIVSILKFRGRSLEDGLPTSIDLRASDKKKALDTSVDEIISAVKYLLSKDSSYTTGSSVIIDGGWTSW